MIRIPIDLTSSDCATASKFVQKTKGEEKRPVYENGVPVWAGSIFLAHNDTEKAEAISLNICSPNNPLKDCPRYTKIQLSGCEMILYDSKAKIFSFWAKSAKKV